MTNNNDIIEMLNRVVCHTTSEYEHKQRVIKVAKVLVERDEAKKAIMDTFGMFESWVCPTCKYMIFRKQRFCGKCGQRLDWSSDER